MTIQGAGGARPFLTMRQLCEHLQVTKPTVILMIERGMPAMKTGRFWRFDLDAVKDWMSQQVKQP